MLKKLISGLTSVIIACSMLAGTCVSAASPIVYDGTVVNMFDQSLAGLSGASDIPDFTVSGTWDYTKYHILGGKGVHKTVNMTGADGYEFTTETIITHNGFIIDLGWNEDTKTGYQIYIQYKSGAYLYKNEEFVNSARDLSTPQGAIASSPFANVYSIHYKYTVKVSNKTLTLIAKDIPRGDEYTVLTYTDTDLPSMSGKFGVRNCGTGNFTVFNIKLDRINENTVVNNWRYEKVFSSEDTVEQLRKDGVTFTGTAIRGFYDNGVYTGGGTCTTFSPNGGGISGDYTLETAFTKKMNGYEIQFNYLDNSNYYSVVLGGGYVKLIKKKSGEEDVVYQQAVAKNPGIRSNSTEVKYTISVKENTDDTRTIVAEISGKNQTETLTGTDLTPFSNPGSIRVKQNASGDSILHYIKAYATPTNQVTGTRDVTVVDKAIQTGDSVESLANEGIVMETAPLGFVTPEDKVWSGTTYKYGAKYDYFHNYDTDTDKNDGLWCRNFDGTGKNVKLYYDKDLSGDYTVTSTARVQYNCITYYLNYQDSKNYYRIYVYGSKVVFAKCLAGETYTYTNPQITGGLGKNGIIKNFNGRGCTVTLGVINNEDGSLIINGTMVTEPWNNDIASFTLIDDGVTNGNALTSGKFKMDIATNAGAFYDLKIVEHQEVVDDGEFTGDFYNGDSYISSYEKGDIYFDFPVAAIGSYNVVAALYEDNMMTELKTFEPLDLYAGKVKLFDTKNSNAEKSSIKVYLLDTSSALNQITQVWELK